MQIGVVYPQNEIETDRGAVRHFAQAVEEMGFTHVQTLEHVIDVNSASRPGWNMPFDIEDPFHMAREYGRDPTGIGIEGRLYIYGEDPQAWVDLALWGEMDVSHLAVNTHLTGVRGVHSHLRKLAKFREAAPAGSVLEAAG